MTCKRSRFSSLARVAALNLALFACCHGQKVPTVPTAQQAGPLAIPNLAAPADPGVMGYVKVREPRKLVAELGEAEVRRVLSAKDLDLNILRPGVPATLVLWGPDGFAFDKIPLGAFVSMQQTPPGMLKDKESGAQQLDELTFLPITPPAKEHAKSVGSLLPLAREPGPWDVQLFLGLSSLTRTYGTQLHIGLGALQGVLMAQPKKPGAPDPAAMGSIFTKMLTRLEAMDSYALGLNFLPDEVELETVLRDRQSTPGGAVSAPDLAQFLSADDIRMQWNLRDLGGKVNTYLDWYMPLLNAATPGMAEPFRALLTDIGKLGEAQTAISASFDATGQMRGEGVWLCKDPEGYLAALRRGIDMLNQKGVKDSYRELGFDIEATRAPSDRKIYGWPVEHFAMHMTLRKDARQEQRAAFEKMPFLSAMGNLRYDVMRMGGYVLFSINGSLEALAGRVLSGRGEHPLRAAHVFPAGGTVYGDVDMAGVVRMARSFLPKDAVAKLPDPQSLAGVVTFFSYDGGIASDSRVRVPRSIISALAKKAK